MYEYKTQIELQKKRGPLPDEPPAIACKVREHTLFCIDELMEAMHELPCYKPWKLYKDTNIPREFIDELADAYIFFMNIMIYAGINYDVLLDAVHKKQLINIARWRTPEYTEKDV